MTCQSCGGFGMIRVPWADASDDFAICLCDAGQSLRRTQNAGKDTGFALWQVWATRHQIDPSRIYYLEEILTARELSERGLLQSVDTTPPNREAALLSAASKRRVKL